MTLSSVSIIIYMTAPLKSFEPQELSILFRVTTSFVRFKAYKTGLPILTDAAADFPFFAALVVFLDFLATFGFFWP